MITPIETAWEPNLWRQELRQALRSNQALLEFLGLPADAASPADTVPRAEQLFAVLVPRGFARRMTPGKADDPLLLQVLGDAREGLSVPGFIHDPLDEQTASAGLAPGLVKKYQGRALLITTAGCAVHCRYCFRRHFPYAEHRDHRYAAALSAIHADTSISEVILSGGDPLLLDDSVLDDLLKQLGDINHLRRVRIHTRIPVVLPERVTQGLLAAMHGSRLPLIMVIHANHAQELDATTARALAALRPAVRFMCNQAVLLRDVNDSATAQVQLCERLFEQGVQPYYLHLPDRVAGTHYFFVEQAEAVRIHRDMQATLPGYLVPKLVREISGEPAKTLIFGNL